MKAYIAGTYDTKSTELGFLEQRIADLDIETVSCDLSTSGNSSPASITAQEIASYHPQGPTAVFTGDRGSSIAGMAEAFVSFIRTRADVGGIIAAGGGGGTALVTPAMQALPIGVPKVMISTMASGNVAPYVGSSDICMLYSVTDIQGLNRISERVLANGTHALAGMMKFNYVHRTSHKPAIGLTMFGVTTPCVQAVTSRLQDTYDCLVFHATGTGGRSFEKLIDSGAFTAVIDVTTTEIADHLFGGVLSAGEDRLGSIIRTRIPYVGSVGALDMVNFGAKETVPRHYAQRNLYVHNPQVTLMRTTPEENAIMGRWLAERLNQMHGPVRFLLPLKGVSLIDAPGKVFYDPAADEALFDSLKRFFMPAANRKLISCDLAINDPEFSEALLKAFQEIV